MAHISRKHYEFLKDHAVYQGDLVIRALGIPAPRACRIPDIGPAIVKADCIRFKVADDFIDPNFVLFALNSPATQQRTEKKIHGVGRPRLNLSEIKAIALPLPPQVEQMQIARQVERRLAAADRLAVTLNNQLERARGTRQSLLHQAFAGKLVPQEPTDEPASVLLHRIRSAREAQKKKPKSKRMPKPRTESAETLEDLEVLISKFREGLSPERLLTVSGLGRKNDIDGVEKFFDLLRAGRDKGSLVVPVGKRTAIKRVERAN
jgi:type I restriction enzyme, S subunit